VPLAEAMPVDKFDFKPAGDGFKDSRTFKQMVGHAGTTLNIFAATLLGEDAGYTEADEQNGPASLKTKEDYVNYLKAAFVHAHKAVQSVNEKNMTEIVDNKVNKFQLSRLAAANLMVWHTFDHYGQLCIYLRSNNIVPPASR